MELLRIEHLKKVYNTKLGFNQCLALRDVSFSVNAGEFVAVMGASGAVGFVYRGQLKEAAANEELPLVFYMFTDVKTSTTELLYFGEGAEDLELGVAEAARLAQLRLHGVVQQAADLGQREVGG